MPFTGIRPPHRKHKRRPADEPGVEDIPVGFDEEPEEILTVEDVDALFAQAERSEVEGSVVEAIAEGAFHVYRLAGAPKAKPPGSFVKTTSKGTHHIFFHSEPSKSELDLLGVKATKVAEPSGEALYETTSQLASASWLDEANEIVANVISANSPMALMTSADREVKAALKAILKKSYEDLYDAFAKDDGGKIACELTWRYRDINGKDKKRPSDMANRAELLGKMRRALTYAKSNMLAWSRRQDVKLQKKAERFLKEAGKLVDFVKKAEKSSSTVLENYKRVNQELTKLRKIAKLSRDKKPGSHKMDGKGTSLEGYWFRSPGPTGWTLFVSLPRDKGMKFRCQLVNVMKTKSVNGPKFQADDVDDLKAKAEMFIETL